MVGCFWKEEKSLGEECASDVLSVVWVSSSQQARPESSLGKVHKEFSILFFEPKAVNAAFVFGSPSAALDTVFPAMQRAANIAIVGEFSEAKGGTNMWAFVFKGIEAPLPMCECDAVLSKGQTLQMLISQSFNRAEVVSSFVHGVKPL
jgi:hypothetical protein